MDVLASDKIIKRELIWQQVKEDARSKKLGLITAEEEIKCKQRLTDKVCKEVRQMNKKKAATQVETCLGKTEKTHVVL